MENNEIRFIQDQIGYEFTNQDLLRQAFVRKSFSNENGGQNNEVLEFIGDKVLDYVVVKLLSDKYGEITNESSRNEYVSRYAEGTLTNIKKKLVQKSNLAYRIRRLSLEQFLIMGNSDLKQNIQNEDSVQEDLFEALLGAIAIDSEWNMQVIQDAVEIMLNPDEITNEDDNYVELIQKWTLQRDGAIPLYHYEEGSYQSAWYTPFDGISQQVNVVGSIEERELMSSTHRCLLKISDDIPIFRGFGTSKNQARKNVCKVAYEYLDSHGYLMTIKDEIENPNIADAINQLEILARRGYFEIPTYEFLQTYDSNGNPSWKCSCLISGEVNMFTALSSSKKEAKKLAAYKMLEYVLQI